MAEKNNYYGSGIFVAGNIDIGAIGKPADSRVMVPNPSGLAELVADKRVYDGMIVYCESTKTYHKCSVEWDSSMNITSSSWKQVEIQSLDELKALIAQESTAAMEFKGTLKDGTLPTLAEGINYDGNLYKVATKEITIPAALNAEGGEADVVAKPGDSIVCEGGKWYLIPSGDDIENTWRAIKVNGVEKLSGGITSGDVDFVQGNNVTITEAAGVITIAAADTHYESKLVAANSATDATDETAEDGQVHLNLIENGEVKSSHKIVGGGGISVTHTVAEGEDGVNVITIEAAEGAKYDLTAKTENNEAILSLAGTDNTEDKVAIVGDDAVAVTVDGGKIKVSAHDTKYNSSTGTEINVTVVDDGAITADLVSVGYGKLAQDVKDAFASAEYVGTIPVKEQEVNGEKVDVYAGLDVVGYINKKAEETLAAAQGGSSETAASVKQQLDNYKDTNNTRVKAIEDDIANNRDAWAKNDNDNTTYQFSIPTEGNDKGKLLVEKKEIGEDTWTKVDAYDFTTPDELAAALANYYTKEEVINLLPTELGVMSVGAGNDAIEITGTDAEPKVGVKLNSVQGNVVLTVDGGLKAEVDLAHNHDNDYKKIQTAVVDPTADGETLTFIDTISQNAQGVITVTKKTVGKVADATHADTADEATHATNADEATHAVNADNATHATKADKATHADAATKVDNALTIKVGGATKTYDGSATVEADVDTAIATAISAIPEQIDYTVTCADADFDATEEAPAFKRHTLTQNGKQVCVIDVPRDLVVKSGRVDKDTNELVLVLVNDEEIRVDVSHLIEYVTGDTATDGIITVSVSDDFVTTATINDGTITEAKLHADVAAKLNKDDNTTYGFASKTGKDFTFTVTPSEGDAYDVTLEANGKADKVASAVAGNFAGLDANGNLVDSGKKAGDFDAKGAADAAKSQAITAAAADATGKANAAKNQAIAAAAADASDKAAVVLSEAQKYANNAIANTSLEAGTGLKVAADNNKKIEIDTDVVFVLDCNW